MPLWLEFAEEQENEDGSKYCMQKYSFPLLKCDACLALPETSREFPVGVFYGWLISSWGFPCFHP